MQKSSTKILANPIKLYILITICYYELSFTPVMKEWFTIRKINHIFISSFISLKMKIHKIILVDKKRRKTTLLEKLKIHS